MRARLAPLAPIVLALVLSLALAGCAAPKPADDGQPGSAEGLGSVVGTAKDNASIVACRTNRAQLDEQISAAQVDASGAPAQLAALVQQLGVRCPSGGTYRWDAAAGKTRCSVHGE